MSAARDLMHDSKIIGLDGQPLKRIGLNETRFAASGLSNGAANLDSPTMSSWKWGGGAADDDIVQHLPVVRQRCRDLALNAPIVAGIINTLVTNVVGVGLIPEPTPDWQALGLSEDDGPEWSAKWKKEVLRLWEDWAESKTVDVTGRNNFYELTQLIFRAEIESGDVFVTMPYTDVPGSLIDLRIQVIEADCITNPMISSYGDIEGDVFGGVEVNEHGTVVAYWVATKHPLGRRHPAMYSNNFPKRQEWVRVPVYGDETGRRNILHVMRSQRPGQRRGIPILAPVVEATKMLDRYCRAELQAALVQTLFTAAIKTKSPDQAVGEYDAMSAELLKTGITAREDFYGRNGEFAMGSGTVSFLAPGDEIQPVGVTHPESGFGAFVESQIKMMSGAMGVPYEMAVQFFQTSFSASKAAINMASAQFEVWRDHLITDYCQPIYKAFMTEVVAVGLIEAPGFFDDRRKQKAYCDVQFGGPGDLSIDPEKELRAMEKAIGLGLLTHTKASLKYDGSDFAQNMQVLSEEQRVIDAAKIDRTPLTASSTYEPPEDEKK